MAEDKIVRITCIELAENKNRLHAPPCQNEEKVKPGTWLSALQKKHQANQITKFPYKTDGWAYLLKGKGYYLYDCQGTLIKSAELAEDCMKGEITRPKGRPHYLSSWKREELVMQNENLNPNDDQWSDEEKQMEKTLRPKAIR